MVSGSPPRTRRQSMLLREYEALSQDERSSGAVLAGLISVAVALLGGIGALVLQTCLLERVPAPGVGTSSCLNLPGWLYAAMPLGPLAIIAFYLPLGAISVARSYYTRALEYELLLGPSRSVRQAIKRNDFPVPSFQHLVWPVYSQRGGWMRYRVLLLLSQVAVGVTFICLTTFLVVHARPIGVQLVAAVFYILATGLLVRVAWGGAVQGARLWGDLQRHLPASLERTRELVSGEGSVAPAPLSLAGYLACPRPVELLIKSPFLLGGLALGAVATSGRFAWSTWLWVLVGFEFFLYQSRYQLNDLRNVAQDETHAFASSRRRFPPPITRRRVALGLGTAAIRLLAWGAIVATLWASAGKALLLAGTFALLLAIAYELLRTQAPDPPTLPREPPNLTGLPRASPAARGITLLVGVGYGVRTALGIWVGSTGSAPDWSLLLAGVAVAAFGVLFVSMTWVLEGTALIARDDQQRRGGWVLSSILFKKPHIALLLRESGYIETPIRGRLTDGHDTRLVLAARERPLRKRGPEPLLRPMLNTWNIALIVSLALGVLFGLALANGLTVIDFARPWSVLAALIGALLLARALVAVRSHLRLTALVTVIAGTLLTSAAMTMDLPRPGLAPVPLVVISLTYGVFARASYDDLQRLGRALSLRVAAAALRAWLRSMAHRLFRWLVGEETFALLEHGVAQIQEPGPAISRRRQHISG